MNHTHHPTPHPGINPHAFACHYARAWGSPPSGLLPYFAKDGRYSSSAFATVFSGQAEIAQFHHRRNSISSDGMLQFDISLVGQGHLHMRWQWEGTFNGPLRLRDGGVVAPGDRVFSTEGTAVCEYGDDGKLTVHRDYWDCDPLVRQLTGLDTYVPNPYN
jgi:hypothetical protein